MRIVVIGIQAEALVHFRGDMLREMVAAGHQVLAMAPGPDDGIGEELAAMGVRYEAIEMDRTGVDPLKDVRLTRSLTARFRAYGADAVLAYGAKAVVYGSLAARIARVPLRAVMITGAGSALMGGRTWGRRAVSRMLRTLYAVSLRQTHIVFFQNRDDERLFRVLGLISPAQRRVLINGSGVNLDRFPRAPIPDGPVTFLFVGRLIRDKGLMEFVEAAHLVRAAHPTARARILGGLDSNPTAISPAEVERWSEEGTVEYLGETDDVRPFIADSHVFVLPSYGEGMPRSTLEAMAMGRPVITTDVSGCRETVEEGRNGYLVPVRDPQALAQAMIRLAEHPDDVVRMGAESRRLAEARFDVREVNRIILKEMGLVG